MGSAEAAGSLGRVGESEIDMLEEQDRGESSSAVEGGVEGRWRLRPAACLTSLGSSWSCVVKHSVSGMCCRDETAVQHRTAKPDIIKQYSYITRLSLSACSPLPLDIMMMNPKEKVSETYDMMAAGDSYQTRAGHSDPVSKSKL